jgi:hypothetical protein
LKRSFGIFPNKLLFLVFATIASVYGVSGFAPFSSVPQKQILYRDDFEYYVTSKLVQQSYTAWEDGAKLDVQLEKDIVGDGSQSMRVDVLGPNPMDNVTSGSIYHSLPLTNRDWSHSVGVRFWINNPSIDYLWLTFNFKEAYNEYWAVNPGAPFLLQGLDGSIQQYDCQYGNLVIPPNFTGRVIIPVSSFAVPEWSTARGDKKLQLYAIESYALGVTLQKDFPRTFYIDTFEVLSPAEILPVILGVKQIEIPSSGEHLETFDNVDITTGSKISTLWKVESPNNPDLVITDDGVLIIPSTSKAGLATIYSKWSNSGDGSFISKEIKLTGGVFPQIDNSESGSSSEVVPMPEKTAYDRFASDFEKWAMDYRPLFVVISVSVVVLIIFLLSRFQNKLK